MKGRHPQTIITDIDPTLGDAISKELSQTKHVISTCHILSKIPNWFSLPLGLQYTDFRLEFNILCHMENIENFELQWDIFVARFGLVSDKHISLLFSLRASWPLCYVKSYFVARSLTAEFLQSLDSTLKRLLDSQTCLQGFFEQVRLMTLMFGSLNHRCSKDC